MTVSFIHMRETIHHLACVIENKGKVFEVLLHYNYQFGSNRNSQKKKLGRRVGIAYIFSNLKNVYG